MDVDFEQFRTIFFSGNFSILQNSIQTIALWFHKATSTEPYSWNQNKGSIAPNHKGRKEVGMLKKKHRISSKTRGIDFFFTWANIQLESSLSRKICLNNRGRAIDSISIELIRSAFLYHWCARHWNRIKFREFSSQLRFQTNENKLTCVGFWALRQPDEVRCIWRFLQLRKIIIWPAIYFLTSLPGDWLNGTTDGWWQRAVKHARSCYWRQLVLRDSPVICPVFTAGTFKILFSN